MINQQDPYRQINYLQQCLSGDKRPLGFFLGAGCPMSIRPETSGSMPLIPDIKGITKLVCDKLAECDICAPLLKIVESHFKKDDCNDTTVENILTHIRALRFVAGKDVVRGLSAKNLDDLDEKICGIIQEVVDKSLPNNATPYHQVALWINAVRRENPVEIFTTNYDLLMEQAFEDCRVPYFDGFAGTRKPFFDLRAMEEDMLPLRWARLWKLHGSINWYQLEDVKGVFRGATNEAGSFKRVIHPSHLKYEESRRMPFLAMLDRLRAFLKQPTITLVISGYSFGDSHINEVILQGLELNQTAMAFALLYDPLTSYSDAVKLACGRSNLSLLARDGAVIGGQEVEWIKKEAEIISPDTRQWAKWNPIDSSNKDGMWAAEFNLGDYAVFGNFLSELIGYEDRQSEAKNAK